MLSRRDLLLHSSAMTALGLGGSPLALAGAKDSSLKFIFVMAYGGWDPTQVFATEFSNPNVDMSRGSQEGSFGDLRFVDHRDRPSVREFFSEYGDRSLILNGILVPSVAHETCTQLTLTGSSSTTGSDWPAILAAQSAESRSLPHMVIAGPSFPGEYGSFVTRTGQSGQLEGLLTGEILRESELSVELLDGKAEQIMDRYLTRRLAAAAADHHSGGQALRQGYLQAWQRGQSLKELGKVVDWSAGSSFSGQTKLAVELLSMQLSRCVSLNYSASWDTHTANDDTQSGNFEGLFSGLQGLMQRLQAVPGERSETLADETMIVVFSEMGRTPQLNPEEGKDHWPYSSQLWIGPDITGGRVVGGFDSYYYGETLDLASAELGGERDLSVDVLGATLLRLAGLDSERWLPGIGVLEGVLR